MSTQKRLNTNLSTLATCAVMLALAFALSCIKLFEMPMGGSITMASMLPIMLVSIKYGIVSGASTAFLYSLTQLLQAFASGNVFPFCETPLTLVVCILFDYVIPFTVLGLAGILHKIKLTKNPELNVYAGIIAVVLIRFICHFITGVAIWGQWAPEGMGKYLYSLAYNGSFLLVDSLICIICAIIMFRERSFRKLMHIE